MEININCDLGEKSKLHSNESDPELLEIVNSANIACGYHAGDENTMNEVIEISNQDKIESLYDFHIWTDEYAQGRLNWKPMVPLSIILVRVYDLASKTSVPFIPEYQGCTSWVDIIPAIDMENKTPVLSDEAFEVKANEIKKALS